MHLERRDAELLAALAVAVAPGLALEHKVALHVDAVRRRARPVAVVARLGPVVRVARVRLRVRVPLVPPDDERVDGRQARADESYAHLGVSVVL